MDDQHNQTYDVEFLTRALNLIPYSGLESYDHSSTVKGAFNAGAVVGARFDESNGNVAIKLHGGETILMNEQQAAELEATIKRRSIEYQELQAADIQRRAELEAQAQIGAASRAIGDAAMLAKLKRRGS